MNSALTNVRGECSEAGVVVVVMVRKVWSGRKWQNVVGSDLDIVIAGSTCSSLRKLSEEVMNC